METIAKLTTLWQLQVKPAGNEESLPPLGIYSSEYAYDSLCRGTLVNKICLFSRRGGKHKEPGRQEPGDMEEKVGRQVKKYWLIGVLGVCLLATPLMAAGQKTAESTGAALAPQLKPDTPRLDTPAESKPPVKKTVAPLQGNIRQDNKLTNTRQGLFGSAGKFFGRAGQGLPGRSRNQLPGTVTNQDLQAEVESGIGIIGVRFVMYLGKSPTINRVFPMTPAAEKGILNDDVIVAVDGVPTAGLSKEEVYDMIVGKPGTPVTLSIQRNGDFQVFNLVRMDLNDITDPFIRRDYMRSM